MSRTLLLATTLLGLAAPLAARAEPPQRKVAVTVDDLPWVGPRPDGSKVEAVAAIAEQIENAGAPAWGFVVGRRGDQSPTKAWVDAGFPVGNHTLTHRRYSELPIDEFVADVKRNEDKIRKALGVELRGTWFRYPFLDHGHTEAKVEAMAAYMKKHGYGHAPVSLDTVDYRFANAYAKASDKQAVAKIYVEHVEQSAAHFEALSKKLYDREIPLVLLLHANVINANHAADVLAMLKARGYSFIKMEEALGDPAYEEHGLRPPLVLLKGDRNFLNQVALSRGMKVDDPSGDAYYKGGGPE